MKNERSKQKKAGSAVEEPTAIYGLERNRGRLNPVRTAARIRAGLPTIEFDGLAELLNISPEQFATHLAISRSTLVRRRKAGRLGAQESDRLLRYARLWNRAREVLAGEMAAREWLRTPARALGFETPLSFAETEAGAREVENLLGRIEHGVFS